MLASARLERKAVSGQERLPGSDLAGGTWQDLAVSDDGTTITVTLDGVELLRVNDPLPAGFEGRLADGTPSTHASQHATSFPLSRGITDPAHVPADAQRITDQGMRQGPMTVHRLVRALLASGRIDGALDLLTNPSQPGWVRLLDRGATFTWEAWELVAGTDYSQSHAWSASVLKEILEFLLGVRTVVPGGSELLIEPPACRLEHASGSVPLLNGPAAVSWRRMPRGVRLECAVPAGVTPPSGCRPVHTALKDRRRPAPPPSVPARTRRLSATVTAPAWWARKPCATSGSTRDPGPLPQPTDPHPCPTR